MIDIEKAIVAMASNGVEFVIVGGVARSVDGLVAARKRQVVRRMFSG